MATPKIEENSTIELMLCWFFEPELIEVFRNKKEAKIILKLD